MTRAGVSKKLGLIMICLFLLITACNRSIEKMPEYDVIELPGASKHNEEVMRNFSLDELIQAVDKVHVFIAVEYSQIELEYLKQDSQLLTRDAAALIYFLNNKLNKDAKTIHLIRSNEDRKKYMVITDDYYILSIALVKEKELDDIWLMESVGSW